MDLKKEIKDNQILLILVPKDSYKEHFVKTIKTLQSLFENINCLLISNPYSAVKEDLEESNIDIKKMSFIDTLTSTVKNSPETEGVSFASSPSDLTEMSMMFSSRCGECDAAIIDSISTLLVYNDVDAVTKFSHSLVTKARTHKKHLVFIGLKEDEDSKLVKELHVFCNKVISLKI